MNKNFKYLIILAVAASVAACDLITKRWAERSLASYEHPKPVVVGQDEDGMSLKTLFQKRFPGRDAGYLASVSERLDMAVRFSPDDKVFTVEEKAGNLTGFYLFHKGDLSVSPRRLDRRELFKAEKVLRASRPELSQAEVRKMVREQLGSKTIKEFVIEKAPQIDPEDVETLIRGFLFPARPNNHLPEDVKVKTGEVYLVNDLRVELVPGNLQMIYAENPGAAWGLFSDADEDFRQFFFSILTFAAIFVIGYLFIKMRNEKMFTLIALAAIVGGAVGNLTDRLMLRYVVDFIDMYYGEKHWPTYNVADIAISVGVGVLFVTSLFAKKKRENPA
ncbi:MAG: signal peptidase II [Deltaproteobacteria bacterium]|nr:signal peptidase II [Deltaproteobacteria bacterium]